jgi:TRAP-type C4-dicarboxylate transport system permease small subunit
MRVLAKLDKCVSNILLGGALTCIISLLVLLVVNLLLRILGTSTVMDWYAEVVELLFAWMVFLTASILSRGKEHFHVNLLEVNYAGRRWYHILKFVINLLGVLFFFSLFCFSLKLTYDAEQTMAVLPLSRRWAYACVPFNTFFMCIYTIRDSVQDLLAYRLCRS